MNWLDLSGAALSLVSTYHFTKSRHTAWMIGILAILLNTVLYAQKGIYGHVFLEFIYLFVMIAGLRKWKSAQSNAVYQLNLKQVSICIIAVCTVFSLYALVLIHLTPSKIPFWDAGTTVLCLFAQGLMIYKILLCWMIWFVVDAMMAVLQWQQGMPFHSLVTTMYLGLAVLGYLRWRKLLVQEAFVWRVVFSPDKSKAVTSPLHNGLANKNP